MVRGRVTLAAVAVVLLAALTGCSDPAPPEPSPSPSATPSVAPEDLTRAGLRVTVVVPPAAVVARAEGAALAQAARDLAEEPPTGIASVRVVEAASEAFVRDLANLAADDGDDLVCVVGTGSAALALELARDRRDARFCTTDGDIAGGPVNLTAVALDPAATVRAGAIAIGTAPAPVGLLLSAQLGDGDTLTTTFVETVAQPVQPSPPPPASPPAEAVPTPDSSPTPDVEAPGPTAPQPPFVTVVAGGASAAQASAGEQLAAERPSRALVLATPGGAEAASATADSGATLVGVVDWLVDAEGEPPSNLLVGLTVDWATLLTDALTTAQEDEPTQVTLRGAGVLGALPGGAVGATPAAERTTAFLAQESAA